MQMKITPTRDQIAAALASVWGTTPNNIMIDIDLEEVDITIKTDLKGAQKAERAIAKVIAG